MTDITPQAIAEAVWLFLAHAMSSLPRATAKRISDALSGWCDRLHHTLSHGLLEVGYRLSVAGQLVYEELCIVHGVPQ